MDSIEMAFRSAALEFLAQAKAVPVLEQMVFAAVACGGGEVPLYTMVGGLFRNLLTGVAPELRLAINQEIQRGIRPDFQVHHKESFKPPRFAAEFKLLYQDGTANSRPSAVIQRIQADLDKLVSISAAGVHKAMLVFVHHEKAELATSIQTALADMKFEFMGQVELWKPEGTVADGRLRLYLLGHEEIEKLGHPVPLTPLSA
jgi:hypothetical protein